MKIFPSIVIIGGGTGTFVTLSGLKKYPVQLDAIVTMMDSGGSSGRLRDELGVLPPGDIRQCLVALSHSSLVLRELFAYRFSEGSLEGHTFGNIFLSALEKTTGSMKDAIKHAGDILDIHGHVLPVTFDQSQLCVTLTDQSTIIGETHIDEIEEQIDRPRIMNAFLSPQAQANPDALKAIKHADLIVLGPGDLYTSVIPNLLVDGIAEAIRTAKAKKLFVMNLMTKRGQTTAYSAKDHIDDLEKYLGNGVLTHIVINKKKPAKLASAWYEQYGESNVTDDLPSDWNVVILRKAVAKDRYIEKSAADRLTRSIIRHDPDKLARIIYQLVTHH